jgi:hypothetical protein
MPEENNRYVTRAGTFLCRVKKPGNGWFGEQGKNNTPFLRIPCFVTDDGDQEGKEITWKGWLTQAAFDRTILTLCKVFPRWDGDFEALQNDTFSFAGFDCEIVAESKTYNNEKRVEATWLNAVGGGGGKLMDAGKVASLISKLGRKAKAIAKQAGSQVPAASRASSSPAASRENAPSAPDETDDIPF